MKLCANCKHFEHSPILPELQKCCHSSLTEEAKQSPVTGKWFPIGLYAQPRASKINPNGDCRLYEEKEHKQHWWQIWLSPKVK